MSVKVYLPSLHAVLCHQATYILDKNVQVVVRNDMDVNEHERLSNITLGHKLI